MAKRFGGFTPEQMGKIIPEMKGMQADEQAKYLASQPGAAARLGKMSELAEKRINMAQGGLVKGFAAGGLLDIASQIKMFNSSNAGLETGQQAPMQQPTPGMHRLSSNETNLSFDKASQAIDKEEDALRKRMGFDPRTIKTQADADANKDKLEQYGKAMTDFSNSNPDVVAARNNQRQGLQQNVAPTALDTAQQGYADAQRALQASKDALAKDPQNAGLIQAVKDKETALTLSQEKVNSEQQAFKTTEIPTSAELVSGALNDPTSMITETGVEKVGIDDKQIMDTSAGQVTGDLAGKTAGVTAATDVATPTKTDAPQVDTATTSGAATQYLEGQETPKGIVSEDVKITAEQGTISGGGLADTEARVSEDRIQEVVAGERTVSDKELVDGAVADSYTTSEAAGFEGEVPTAEAAKFDTGTPQVDAADAYTLTPTDTASMTSTKVEDAAKASEIPTADAAVSTFKSIVEGAKGEVGSNELVNAKDVIGAAQAVEAVAASVEAINEDAVAKAAQGTFSQTALATATLGAVPAQATVSGQMEKLMQQFNDGTPAWAAGAMRAANAAMAARGLGGSSLAGAAIVQSMMEAAIPIAQADAQVFANMNLTNVNNRQQVSLANAAAQQGMDLQNLSNEQQVAIANSTNSFALQSQNLSNQQAVVLANAQMKAGLQETVLSINTQTSLTNASRYAERANINLTNAQQATLQRSSENLQVDLANLSSQEQTAIANLQVRASMLGQELTNDQQMAMLESTQNFAGAEFDASAKQQAFMQDAQARAALEGKALDARQQTQLFNVSNIMEERGIEMTNEQQTRLFNSTNRLTVDIQDMSNRQQTALANAQIEAATKGQELNNKQQAAVLNAEKFAEANNMTFTAEQSAALQNSTMMQTIGMAEMSASQAASLQNAATLASMDMANLNNRQQAQVENAKSFLQMDMANLNNEQQGQMFKMQSTINTMMSDTAATNASNQFNASSQMQTDQFFSNLSSTISMFNNEQTNGMTKFEAGQADAMEQFNVGLENMREQFNASNSLVIEQANTNWYKTVATLDTAATNEANRSDAAAANNMTAMGFSSLMQETRDLMDYAWKSANNDADRATQLAIAQISSDDAKAAAKSSRSQSFWSSLGNVAAAIIRD